MIHGNINLVRKKLFLLLRPKTFIAIWVQNSIFIMHSSYFDKKNFKVRKNLWSQYSQQIASLPFSSKPCVISCPMFHVKNWLENIDDDCSILKSKNKDEVLVYDLLNLTFTRSWSSLPRKIILRKNKILKFSWNTLFKLELNLVIILILLFFLRHFIAFKTPD